MAAGEASESLSGILLPWVMLYRPGVLPLNVQYVLLLREVCLSPERTLPPHRIRMLWVAIMLQKHIFQHC